MPGKGREHFDTYTQQNRVKHAILTKYFGAYLRALSGSVDAFHYIDGCAGARTASCGESALVSFERLEAAVRSAPGLNELLEAPWLRCAAFSDCLDELLARPVY